MAKLSERIVKVDIKLYTPPNGFEWTLEGESYEDYKRRGWLDAALIESGYLKPQITKLEYIEESGSTGVKMFNHVADMWGIERKPFETDSEVRDRLLEKMRECSLDFKPLQLDQKTIKGTLDLGENTMTNTLRTLNITLLDLSPELKGEDKVVYEKQGIRTEYTDDQTIQNQLATGDVLSALTLHNENVRVKTLDNQYKGSAREVFLEAIDHLGDSRLKWEVVRVG